ncbi:MAG: hypothetical protein ACT4OO_02660 [Nitrospiraceae bacterium]
MVLRLPSIFAIILCTVSGCSPWRLAYFEDTVSQAPQGEIIHKFGYPQRLQRLENGDELWEYDYVGVGTRCAEYRLTFDGERKLRQWERMTCERGAAPGEQQQGSYSGDGRPGENASPNRSS